MGEARRRFEEKVVLISGIGHGQGRQHAIDFAREGAKVIGFDICEEVVMTNQPLATEEELAETIRLVEEAGGEILAEKADARSFEQVNDLARRGYERWGRLDVVVANAGIAADMVKFWEVSERGWRDVIDVNLTGVWQTAKAAVPFMMEAGNGGAIVNIGSTGSGMGCAHLSHYVAAKHGLIGLTKTMAIELADQWIRANLICPTNVATTMFMNPTNARLFAPHLDEPSMEDFEVAARAMNLLPLGWIEPEDVSEAVRWISSDEARYVTGVMLPIDAGCLTR